MEGEAVFEWLLGRGRGNFFKWSWRGLSSSRQHTAAMQMVGAPAWLAVTRELAAQHACIVLARNLCMPLWAIVKAPESKTQTLSQVKRQTDQPKPRTTFCPSPLLRLVVRH